MNKNSRRGKKKEQLVTDPFSSQNLTRTSTILAVESSDAKDAWAGNFPHGRFF